MTAIVKFPGIPVTLGGDVFIIPPLSLNALRQLQPALAKFTGGVDDESIVTVIDAAHASLARNYPTMDKNMVADLIDVGNMKDIMEAVMDVSGLKRKAGEQPASGEMMASQ